MDGLFEVADAARQAQAISTLEAAAATAVPASTIRTWVRQQRNGYDLGGLTLMGVRLYNAVSGRFLSVDPIAGGNANAYVYPADPISDSDVSGKTSWDRLVECAKIWKKIAIAAYQVHKRGSQLEENIQQLEGRERENYIKTFEDWQKRLRRQLKAFHKCGCDDDDFDDLRKLIKFAALSTASYSDVAKISITFAAGASIIGIIGTIFTAEALG